MFELIDYNCSSVAKNTILKPTTDVFTLSLVALPMWVLYEVCIWIVKNSRVNENTFAA